MTPREANVLLTQAALLDVRLRRDPAERADMATAWAMVLADVSLELATLAVVAHYRDETRAVMPADIVGIVTELAAIDRTPATDGRAWLEARGIDPDAFEARVDAGERPTRVLRELGVLES